jgi:hypothetical protein
MGILDKLTGGKGPDRDAQLREEKKQKFAEIVTELGDNAHEAPRYQAAWLVNRATHFAKQGDLKIALDDLNDATELKKDHFAAYIGMIAIFINDPEKVKMIISMMPEEQIDEGKVTMTKAQALERIDLAMDGESKDS